MTDQQARISLQTIYETYAKIRELNEVIAREREKIDQYTGKETFQLDEWLAEYHDRVEDYIRGANATALKAEAPELFAKYGKTSNTRTLRVYKVE